MQVVSKFHRSATPDVGDVADELPSYLEPGQEYEIPVQPVLEEAHRESTLPRSGLVAQVLKMNQARYYDEG